MAGQAPQSGNRQSSSHVVALLSLNVLLLAFFILLNSLASFEEERRGAVVESVRDAFQGLLPAARNVSNDPAGLDLLEGADDIIESLSQLFGDDLPLVERSESSGGRILQVDLPVGDLFTDQGNELRPYGAESLRLIAGVLADPRFAQHHARVDVLYGLGGHSSGIAGNDVALLRAGLLARALEREGVAPASLSAGLLPDFPDRVRLHFTVDAEPAAVQPGAGGGEG